MTQEGDVCGRRLFFLSLPENRPHLHVLRIEQEALLRLKAATSNVQQEMFSGRLYKLMPTS